jgi:hypothetical protein
MKVRRTPSGRSTARTSTLPFWRRKRMTPPNTLVATSMPEPRVPCASAWAASATGNSAFGSIKADIRLGRASPEMPRLAPLASRIVCSALAMARPTTAAVTAADEPSPSFSPDS